MTSTLPTAATAVTARSRLKAESVWKAVHGLSGDSATHHEILPGCPWVERLVTPGRALPRQCRSDARLGRLERSGRAGRPAQDQQGGDARSGGLDAEEIEGRNGDRLQGGQDEAKSSGRQPAITEQAAMSQAVGGAMASGTGPARSSDGLQAARYSSTRAGVGGRTSRPSVSPRGAEAGRVDVARTQLSRHAQETAVEARRSCNRGTREVMAAFVMGVRSPVTERERQQCLLSRGSDCEASAQTADSPVDPGTS